MKSMRKGQVRRSGQWVEFKSHHPSPWCARATNLRKLFRALEEGSPEETLEGSYSSEKVADGGYASWQVTPGVGFGSLDIGCLVFTCKQVQALRQAAFSK